MLDLANDQSSKVIVDLLSYYLVGYVVIDADKITNTAPYYVLLQNVVNPVREGITSFFTLSLQMGSTITENDNSFSRILITAAPSNSTSLATFSTDPVVEVVGQGSTFLVTVPILGLGSWYSESELMSIRLILPVGFSSSSPLCSIASNLTGYDMTFVPV